MTTRSTNIKRNYEFNEDELLDDVPIVADDTVYEGSAVGDTSGTARPLQGGDVFIGFSLAKVANEGGSASAKNVRLKKRGSVQLPVVGVTSTDDINAVVYGTDDDTFTLTASGASSIGKMTRWISGTNCIVRFEAASVRSI